MQHNNVGKVMSGMGDFKDVYKQLIANPQTEIVAMGDGEKIDC